MLYKVIKIPLKCLPSHVVYFHDIINSYSINYYVVNPLGNHTTKNVLCIIIWNNVSVGRNYMYETPVKTTNINMHASGKMTTIHINNLLLHGARSRWIVISSLSSS